MNKKMAIIILIIVLLIVLIVFFLIKNNKTINPSGGNKDVSIVSDQERVLEETKVIELNSPDFMERSGFELIKSDDLADVKFGKIYSQSVGKAQVNFIYNNNDITLFISKKPLYIRSSGDDSQGVLLGDTETIYVLGDDGINNYYYQKGSAYYQMSTSSNLENDVLIKLINGFDIKIGENY